MAQNITKKGGTTIRSRKWEPVFDEGRYWRARIGFVLISSEQTIEQDVFRMAPRGVGVHFTRVRMLPDVNVENLRSMAELLPEAAALILPEEKLDVICYACTAGSVVIGEERVAKELMRAFHIRKATTLITGVVEALHKLKVRKLVIGTPYPDPVNSSMYEYFSKLGFEIINFEGLNLNYDHEIVRVTPEFLTEFAKAIDHPEADAIFLSCGGLRAVDALDTIEKETGKPAVSSNQAMMWHCLRLAGIEDQISGYGRLLVEH